MREVFMGTNENSHSNEINNNWIGLSSTMASEPPKTGSDFIRRLANDHIHYKLFGKGTISPEHTSPQTEQLCKTAKTLRRVSMELEKSNSEFFDNVWSTIDEENASRMFRQISNQVLTEERLNWGRVVSLITFGGKLAEWFWGRQHQSEKVDEVEDWLANSLCEKEEWIKRKGGWDDFNNTFSAGVQTEEDNSWWKPGVFIGISLAAVCLAKTLR